MDDCREIFGGAALLLGAFVTLVSIHSPNTLASGRETLSVLFGHGVFAVDALVAKRIKATGLS
jgi:hypothetical protein